MSEPESIDDRIHAIVPEVDAFFRDELRRRLDTLRGGDPVAVLAAMSRLALRLVKMVLASAGYPVPSDNLNSCLAHVSGGYDSELKRRIPGYGLMPGEVASYLHLIRNLHNPVDHDAERTVLTRDHALNALNAFLSALRWFYCEYDKGPHLKTIFSEGVLPRSETECKLDRIRRGLAESETRRQGTPREAVVGLRFADVGESFKDRVEVISRLRGLLGDQTARFICVIGRGGLGKTALLSKLCAEIERGELRLSKAAQSMGVDGIVYVSCQGTGRPTVGRLFHDVARVLGGSREEEIRICWQDASRPLAEKIRFLLSRIRNGCYLLVLDNFEDVLAHDNTIGDPDLRTFLDLCLSTPHTMRLIATSRERVLVGEAGLTAVRNIALEEGIPEKEAVDLLRELDSDGLAGLKDAPDRLLRKAVQQCFGIPRALKTIAGLLGDDPTVTLERLLENPSLFNARVVENLIEEHFRRLDDDQRRILQAMAVYNRPVPPGAVRYLLASLCPRLDVESCLRTLVRNHFIIHVRGRETFELHPLDREHAYSHIQREPEDLRAVLHKRAAGYFHQLGRPPGEWSEPSDWDNTREEIHHLILAGASGEACDLLAAAEPSLSAWGLYTEFCGFRMQLCGRLDHGREAVNAVSLAESLYQGMDRWDDALEQVGRVEASFPSHGDHSAIADALQIRANILFEKGDFEKSLAIARDNLRRCEETGDSVRAANILNSLGVYVDAVGRWEEAAQFYGRAEEAFGKAGRPMDAMRIRINRSVAEFFLSGPDAGAAACEPALEACARGERRQEEAYAALNMAIYHLAAGRHPLARAMIERMRPWAERETWFSLNFRQVEAVLLGREGRDVEGIHLLDGIVEPFRKLEDNWGEIDAALNRAVLLTGVETEGEIQSLLRKALNKARENDYYLGCGMGAFLLRGCRAVLSAEESAWADDYASRIFPRFSKVFLPAYALVLRGIADQPLKPAERGCP
jgi:tetratricopeptide (TPR) repeat protein